MNEPIGRPPVEKLSDVAWARVERGVFARLDGAGTVTGAIATREGGGALPRRAWLWVAVPAFAAAACLAVLFATRHGTPSASQIAENEPARVVSGAAPSAVSFGDAHITLDADSAIEMEPGAEPTALLEHGAAWFSVAPRGDRPAFQVRAGDAIVRVIGTRFRVARSGERVDVIVDHGTVEIRYRGRAMRVGDGHAWSSTKPAEVAVTAAPTPEPDIEIDPPASVPNGTQPVRHAQKSR